MSLLMKKTMKISRKLLYKEFWEIGITKVVKKYGLDYSKLSKSCKEYNIPVPSSRYWTSLRRGNDVSDLVPPLPIYDDDIIEIFCKSTKSILKVENGTNQSADMLQMFLDRTDAFREQLSFLDNDKVEKIVSTLSGFEIKKNKHLHERVVELRDSIASWDKIAGASVHKRYDYQTGDAIEQPKFMRDISKEQLPRLYKLLDLLFTVFEQIGEGIADTFSIMINQDEVPFEIIESTNKVSHAITKDEAKELARYNEEVKRSEWAWKPHIRKYDYIHNGIFRIKVCNGKYLRDSSNAKLEDMLPDIMILIYTAYWEIKGKREEREEQKRLWREEEQRKELLQERIDAEKDKTIALFNTIDDYRLAMDMRKYAQILSKSKANVDSDYIAWILQKADWVDPTISKTDELLGKREHEKDSEDKNKLQKKRNSFW